MVIVVSQSASMASPWLTLDGVTEHIDDITLIVIKDLMQFSGVYECGKVILVSTRSPLPSGQYADTAFFGTEDKGLIERVVEELCGYSDNHLGYDDELLESALRRVQSQQ